jgi:uncharacterized protein YjiS (DUF1127 family)
MNTSMASNPTLPNAKTTPFNPFATTSFARALRGVCTPFVQWWRNSEARRRLDRLDDRLLRDAGFDPEEVRHEAHKPLWKAFTLVQKHDNRG